MSANPGKTSWLPAWCEPGRLQHGIKLAVAGLLTLALAEWLRLERPAWGVATCIVLVMAKYVGAIGEKALLRTFGNAAGAVLGVLLVGNLAENGFALVAVFFAITAYCSWRYGGNAHPYAFLLAAVTLNRVVVPNLDTPITGAWDTAVDRTLEISLGILVSTAVYSVLWPRYARLDFLAEMRAAVAELSAVLCRDSAAPESQTLAVRSVARLTRLRKLLQAGARESAAFRHHYSLYSDLVTRLSALYVFAETAATHRRTGAGPDIDAIIERLHALAGRRIAGFSGEETSATRGLRGEFQRTLAELRGALLALSGPSGGASHDQAAGAYLVLRHLHSQLRETGELMRFLADDPDATRRYPAAACIPAPAFPTEAFWARNAIKSTAAGCAAWALCEWLQPPGATYIPYFVWFFALLSRQFQENLGDRGVIQFAAQATVWGVGYLLVLLGLTPFMTDYAVMNLLLGAALLAYGYATATFTGWTRWSRVAFFGVLSWLSLDLQHGVGFEAIVTAFFQIVIALWFAAFVDRIWWPILPHWEVCSRLAGFFRAAERYTDEPAAPARRQWIRQMALLANEASAWAQRLDTREFAADEPRRWGDALTATRLLAYRLRLLLFLARRNRAVLARAPDAGRQLQEALTAYFAGFRRAFESRGAAVCPGLTAVVDAAARLREERPAGLAPTHRIVFDGLLAAVDHLVAAARDWESALAEIPLRDYALDRSL